MLCQLLRGNTIVFRKELSGLKGQLSKTECSFQAQGRHPPQITEALRGKQTVNRDVKTASGLNYLLHHCRNGANIE